MFFIGKKEFFCYLAAVLLTALSGLGIFAVSHTVASSVTPIGAVVAIDPGHGGYDGGVVGVSGSKESELNLKIALELGEILTAKGVRLYIPGLKTSLSATQNAKIWLKGRG